ncbi:MAG: hypothetical protein ACLRPV_17665 [Lacrimispora saccharolytica]
MEHTSSRKGQTRSWIISTMYLPKFKKIIPNDYKRMMTAIAQMEEKGLSSEQAQIEAFYAKYAVDGRRIRHGKTNRIFRI